MEQWISPLISAAASILGYLVLSRRVTLLLRKETVEADIDDTKTRRNAEIAEIARKDAQAASLIEVVGRLINKLDKVTDSMNAVVAEQHTEHSLETDRLNRMAVYTTNQDSLHREHVTTLADNTLSIKRTNQLLDDMNTRIMNLSNKVGNNETAIKLLVDRIPLPVSATPAPG